MHSLTPARRALALFALALGGFSIGVTEFASMGVLPNIAADLLPDFAIHPAAEISRAGWLITLYALGVVVGAPIVTALLAAIGIGMTIGTFVGGWSSDRNNPRTLLVSFGALIVSLALYLCFAGTAVGLYVTVFLVGFWFSAMNPAVQARFIRIARDAALMGAAVSRAAFNIGNALGAWLGGVVIAAGFGYLSPGWVGLALASAGAILAITSLSLSRRDRQRQIDTTGIPLP